MTKQSIASGAVGAGLILALAGCTNPYDPAQRAVGGGLLGAGAGAAIGGAVGGGHGAAVGAAIGGAAGEAGAGIAASMSRGAPGRTRGTGVTPERPGCSPIGEGAPQASPEVLTVILGSAPVPGLE